MIPVRPGQPSDLEVGYLEGWYVDDSFRRQGVGGLCCRRLKSEHLLRVAPMASDTWIDNEASQRAHEALGFEIVDFCVIYRKTIVRTQLKGR